MQRRPFLIAGVGLLAIAGAVAVAYRSNDSAPPPRATGPQEVIGAQWLRPVGTEAAFVGDKECRDCHPREFNSHEATPHARTVKAISAGQSRPEFGDPNGVEDPTHGLLYTVQTDAGKHWIMAYDGEKAQRGAPGWAFGSGTNAHTYMSRGANGFIEYRISYYPKAKEWNFTPGHGPNDPLAFPLGLATTELGAASCFGCHSTVLVGTPERLDLEHSRLNIGCESCHGASRAHVESARKAAVTQANAAQLRVPILPARPTGEAQIRMCASCHRSGMSLPVDDSGVEKQLARFAGTALMRSRCYTESGGKLACSSCHDPHAPVSRSPRSYDAACGSCHSPPAGVPCSRKKSSDCVSCHLPEQSIARKLPLRFHNHWIRRTIPLAEQRATALPTASR